MSDLVAKLGFGITLFLFGLRIYVNPRWYAVFKDLHIDFSDHNHFWGIACMLGGIVLTCMVIRQEVKDRKKKKGK